MKASTFERIMNNRWRCRTVKARANAITRGTST
jgi:hypothetical protein